MIAADDTVIVNKYSGDYRIDVLIPAANARWNADKEVGSAVNVSFSFMSAAPDYAGDSDKKGFTEFSEEQKVATRAIFKLISEQFGISFTEVSDSASSYGLIRLGNNAQGAVSAGYAMYPDLSDTKQAGDVYINNEDTTNLSNIVPGTNAWATLVHEIGHAIGLKHPGNYNAGEPASGTPDNFLAKAEDTEANTVMSYNKAPQSQEREFFGKYDYLALKYLYGGKAYHADNTTYTLSDSDGQVLKLINDTGGTDTIDASKLSVAATINLTPGSSSSIGKLASDTVSLDSLSIAYDSLIENVIGTNFADTLIGNQANNRFETRGGADSINGGVGFDLVIAAQAYTGLSVEKSGEQFLFKDSAAVTVLSVQNVERVQFNDNKVTAFDSEGNAGQIYRLYQAAFDRKPDAPGLGYWIADMDKGTPLTTIAAGFFQSAEFQKLYGSNPSINTLITNFYKNVLHREPDQAGFDYWNKEISSGVSTPASALASFCESAENKAQVLASIQNGIHYDLWLG